MVAPQINVHEEFSQHPDATLRDSATSAAQALREWQQQQGSAAAATAASAPLSRESILAHVCSSLESLAPQSLSQVLATYRTYDMLLGHRVVVMPRKREDASSYYEAQATGYSPDGYLVVKTDAGDTKELVAEEVTIRPAATQR